jgi:hypothetical protein
MFVHCLKQRLEDKATLQSIGFEGMKDASVRDNICRTGVVNFFVVLPGGVPLSSNPELRVVSVCETLLQTRRFIFLARCRRPQGAPDNGQGGGRLGGSTTLQMCFATGWSIGVSPCLQAQTLRKEDSCQLVTPFKFPFRY